MSYPMRILAVLVVLVGIPVLAFIGYILADNRRMRRQKRWRDEHGKR